MKFVKQAALSVALSSLAACGGSEPEAPPAPEADVAAILESVEPIVQQQLEREVARSAVQYPCTLYDATVASVMLGGEVNTPNYTYEHMSFNDDAWEAEACSWSDWSDGPTLSVWVSRPQHFADNAVHCFGAMPGTPEEMLGGRAVWNFEGSFGWAQLHVCRDDGVFSVEIHGGPADEPAARELATRIAGDIAATL
ncbi:MAG: hypothetical protein OEV41_00250 [Gammaproteobacteria bacterium]|nr:hypothetical protein [Gammaproteobacteria bacterium]MDH5344523.1 hypothetical protein [Gammaproteobacteria bacterium]